MTTPIGTAIGVALLTSTAAGAHHFDSAGTTIHYTMAGKGEPVVLLHGFIGSSEEWLSPPPFLPPEQQKAFAPAFQVLSRAFCAIAPDLRGHGKSGKPRGTNDYGTEMVNDIVRLLDHLKIKRAHIVGYSMGAFVAAKLVALHPERVRTVVLGGGGALLEGSEQLAFMESVGKSLQAGKGVEPIILAMHPPGQPPPTAEQMAATNQMFLAHQDEQALTQVALGHRQLTVRPTSLKSTKVPALLIIGEHDPLKPSSEATHKLMPHSRLLVLDGLDHVSTELDPKFVAAIRQFLTANAPQSPNETAE